MLTCPTICCGEIQQFRFLSDGFLSICLPQKMTMTIREAQTTVDEWIKTIGVRYFNELTNTAVLMEEVGELARIMAREYGEQSWKPGAEKEDLGDEMADVLFVLICLANQTGVNLEEAMLKNLEKKTKRDLNRHRENSKLDGPDQ
jgi:NTP pyrophosphatase (non-canonical NTP hydrolase)